MRWRQLLVPLGLIVIPGAAVAWLMLGDDDADAPRPTRETAEPEPVVAPPPAPRDDEPRRRPPPRPRPRPRIEGQEPGEEAALGGGPPSAGQGGGWGEPEVGEAYPHPSYNVAVGHLEEGDPAAALEEAEICLKEAPNHRGCWDTKLRAMMAGGDVEGARELVASCSEGRDDPALCMGAEIFVALEDGDLEAAQGTLQALEEQTPRSRYTLMARAQVFAKEGNDKMAKMNFTLACVNGHAVACRRVPGTKQAGAE